MVPLRMLFSVPVTVTNNFKVKYLNVNIIYMLFHYYLDSTHFDPIQPDPHSLTQAGVDILSTRNDDPDKPKPLYIYIYTENCIRRFLDVRRYRKCYLIFKSWSDRTRPDSTPSGTYFHKFEPTIDNEMKPKLRTSCAHTKKTSERYTTHQSTHCLYFLQSTQTQPDPTRPNKTRLMT